MKKIYGAPRYMDWVAQIKAGGATVRVHFTGGSLTVYGVRPAEYTTDNEFLQQVIEQSSYYKDGRIVLLKTVETESKEEARKVVKKAMQSVAEEVATAEGTEFVEDPKASDRVEMSCLQDAQDYLQQHFGIASYKVRSKAMAVRLASEHGVEIDWVEAKAEE